MYQVEEGDNLWSIAQEFGVDLMVLITVNNLDPAPTIRVGDKLIIPAADTKLPSATPLPTNIARGTRIEYRRSTGQFARCDRKPIQQHHRRSRKRTRSRMRMKSSRSADHHPGEYRHGSTDSHNHTDGNVPGERDARADRGHPGCVWAKPR